MRPEIVAQGGESDLVDGAPGTRPGDDMHAAGTGTVGEGTAQGGGLHLLGGPLGVVARASGRGHAAAGHWGARMEPWRARPVPFCLNGLRPPPETSARVFV